MKNIQVSKFLETKTRKKRRKKKFCEPTRISNDVTATYDELEKDAIRYLRQKGQLV